MNEKNDLLDKYYEHFDRDEYEESLIFLRQMEITKEDAAWIYVKTAECLYELRNYREAILYCKKSLKAQSKYPLALWLIANSYYYIGDYQRAKRIFLKLAKMNESEIGKVQTRLGLRWARSIIMDSHLKLADCYYLLVQDRQALAHLKIFNTLKSKKISTCMPKWYISEIRKNLSDV
jgi:tetratricopeptide (TPR) repeat protein